MPKRVVLPIDLIVAIIAARPIRTRQPQFDLFLVHLVAFEVEPYIANHDDASSLAPEIKRQIHWLITLSRGTHNHTVQTFTMGQSHDLAHTLPSAQGPGRHSIY